MNHTVAGSGDTQVNAALAAIYSLTSAEEIPDEVIRNMQRGIAFFVGHRALMAENPDDRKENLSDIIDEGLRILGGTP